MEKSLDSKNKICNKDEVRIPDPALIKVRSTKKRKNANHRRRVSIGINLTRKKNFVKRGEGKNASRPDVILKHILRSLKWFVVDQMKSGDIEAFDCNALSRWAQVNLIKSLSWGIVKNLVSGNQKILLAHSCSEEDLICLVTGLIVPPSVREMWDIVGLDLLKSYY